MGRFLVFVRNTIFVVKIIFRLILTTLEAHVLHRFDLFSLVKKFL